MRKTIKNRTQVIWGTALALVGTSLFFRIPHVINGIEQIDQFASSATSVKFCLYFVGGSLFIGGIRKLFKYIK